MSKPVENDQQQIDSQTMRRLVVVDELSDEFWSQQNTSASTSRDGDHQGDDDPTHSTGYDGHYRDEWWHYKMLQF
ncbi:hypothetical protein RhiirA1_468014 [Rhizophagus irregularis]|uniref:Uncharacterized protein n=1 Tax=Rhizophagus irregularis TaxID=588596 RepID=A0A2N0RAW8_9GLOM|nr:hypothetical protein RhiirA1_468014 [Rhizophagus irregularis]